MGHKYIGIDRSEAYINMTCARLDASPCEMPKIQKELELHVVENTFKDRKAKGKNVSTYRHLDKDNEKQLTLLDTDNNQ